jgi:hypothetical protein
VYFRGHGRPGCGTLTARLQWASQRRKSGLEENVGPQSQPSTCQPRGAIWSSVSALITLRRVLRSCPNQEATEPSGDFVSLGFINERRPGKAVCTETAGCHYGVLEKRANDDQPSPEIRVTAPWHRSSPSLEVSCQKPAHSSGLSSS